MRVSNFLFAGIAGLAGTGLAQSSISSSVNAQASGLLSAIESATTCAACEALLVPLQALAHLGNDAFVAVISEVCILAGAEDADVCRGAIGLEGPIIAHDLREMTVPSHTSRLFCITFFGLCDYPAVRPYTVSFPKPKPATTRPASSGKAPIQVVHFSDIHVDLSYETGANYNCTKNICCRPYTTADAPGNTSTPCGPNGNHQCDSPKTLEDSLYAAVKQYAPNATFALFTGDVVEGAVWLVNQTEVTNDLNSAYHDMASNLGISVYAAVGNHDSAPVNSFPPATINTTINSRWVYDTLSADWTTWIGAADAGQADKYGAYSHVVPNLNLRVISVNTNLYYRENFWLYEKNMEYDPEGQLAWLVSELQAAETAGQRAYITGHIPFGANDVFHDASHYLDQIVNRYDATIAAMFFGHTHKDEFELSYADYTRQSASTATAMSYIAPALTPTSGEPAFRVYTVDPITLGVLDVHAYSASLEATDYQTATGPTWSEYYSAKTAYGPLLGLTAPAAELTPAFWHNLTALFQTNDTVFQAYYARKSRGWYVSNCTDTCKTDEICQLRAARAEDNCVTVKPGINFKKAKRGDGQVGGGATTTRESECHGSKAKEILSRLVGQQARLETEVARRSEVRSS